GNVFSGRKPAQRNGRDEFLPVFRGVGQTHEELEHAGYPHDWANGIDTNVVRSQLDRHGFREQVDGSLAGVVPGEPGTRTDAGRGANVDDGASTLFAHDRHYRLSHVIHVFHVDGKNTIKGVFIDIQHGLVFVRDSCIVHNDVERAECVEAMLDGGV